MSATPSKNLVWDDGRLSAPHQQPDKSRRVRAMFDEIAPTYERVNRVLSAGRDAYWRRKSVALARITHQDRVLDLACGTGDFSRAFAKASPACVVGCDFAEQMLSLAARRSDSSDPLPSASARPEWCRADALSLPFANESFTVISCAFGIRNWENLGRGLAEAHRVLRPGGQMVILEFSMPRGPIIGTAYRFYFRHILPRLATWISGDRSGAYRYLPASVSSFLDGTGISNAMKSAGFEQPEQHRLSAGIVTVYLARKP